MSMNDTMSDTGSVNGGNGSNGNASRHEKSLGLLTTRFVSLLQDAKDGVLDLKLVCTSDRTLSKSVSFDTIIIILISVDTRTVTLSTVDTT